MDKIIEEAALICDKVAIVINQRNKGQLNLSNCKKFCPGQESLVNILNRLALEIRNIEPEYFICLNKELQNLRMPNCINPFSFCAINVIVNLLKMKSFLLVILLMISILSMALLKRY